MPTAFLARNGAEIHDETGCVVYRRERGRPADAPVRGIWKTGAVIDVDATTRGAVSAEDAGRDCSGGRRSPPTGSGGTASARVPALAALAAAALLAAGCGGGAPTKAQYAASADAVCRAAGAQTVPLARQLTTAAGSLSSGNQAAAREAAGALQQLHTVTSAALAKLRALQRPAAGHAAIERFLSSLATVTAALGRAAAAASAGRLQQALAQLQTAAPAAQQMAVAAGTYGMTQCTTLFAGLGATAAGQSVNAAIVGENHDPTVNRPWRYTVTATDPQGRPLSGAETTNYTFNGAVVGTEKPENVKFTGVYRDTIEFPPASVGYPLSVQAVVHASQGTATAEWPVKVHR
jgi:hypothetical protein